MAALPWSGSAEVPRLHLKPVVLEQIDSPTVITHAGDGSGRLFICDQPGKIRIVRHGMLLPAPFLDLTTSGLNVAIGQTTGYSERGLLGLAFHPDYSNSSAPGEGKFYVYYSAPSRTNPNASTPQDHVSVVSEFRVSESDPDLADPTSERVLLVFGQPQSNHNGGQLEFGPDRKLYIGSGDGGQADDNFEGHTGGGGFPKPNGGLGNALDLTKLLGKILRIDPLGTNGPGGTYGIPGDNPFVGAGNGTREEIYAYGLRNPWRFSFDKRAGGSGRLFCGDVGQGSVEEVNLIVSGGNFGWRYREGSFEFDAAMTGAGTAPVSWIDPVAEYAHPGVTKGSPALPQLGLSITGGFVYRGSAIPGLVGAYLFADYRATSGGGGRLMALEETSPMSGSFNLVEAVPLTEANPISGTRRIQTLGENESGEIFVGTKSSTGVLARPNGHPEGGIYQIVPAVESSLSLSPSRDTTMFENSSNSNGSGEHLYAGRTGSQGGSARRRALLHFDLSTIDFSTDILSAAVILHQNLGAAAPVTMTLHRVLADWGEAGSDAGTPGGQGAPAETGDATWTLRFHPATAWANSGGDFVATASASAVIDSTAPDGPVERTWSDAGLIDDLNVWLATPSANFGWALLGDEATSPSAQRFYSRESAASGGALRPILDLTFLAPPPPTPLEAFLRSLDPDAPAGTFYDLTVDTDGDGLTLLLEHGLGLDGLSADPPQSTGLSLSTRITGTGTTEVTATFRRDPGATGVRLALQVASGFSGWMPVAESLGGAAPTALNGAVIVSDLPFPGGEASRLVTVRFETAENIDRRFLRLEAFLIP